MARDYRQELTDKVIEALESGTAPWQKPWHGVEPLMPYNPVSGTMYRGGNVVALMMRGYDDPRWCTYKQAEERGWQVRKGEKATLIEFWKFHDEVEREDPESGEKTRVRVQLERPKVFYANVFNAAQMDNVPTLELEPRRFEWEPLVMAERIMAQAGVPIFHDQLERAYYTATRDEVHLPPKSAFPDAARYYGTGLHELGHATGHPSRLNRELGNSFGSVEYAKEELRAEMASLFLSHRLGVPFEVGRHAAYVGSWIKVLQEDKHEIFRAARDAEEITEYLIERGREREQGRQQPDERGPHELTRAEFAAQAVAERLTNHGRKWNVTLGDHYKAFSDADSAEAAIADVHEAAINNALYLNTPAAAGVGVKPTLPPAAVLDEYPNLVAQYPEALEHKPPPPAVDHGADLAERQQNVAHRTPLDVPFREKEAAKALGAKWDRETKTWFAPVGSNLEQLAKWIPRKETPLREQDGRTVTYSVSAVHNYESQDFADAAEAAQAYHGIPASDRPRVFRVVQGPGIAPGGRAQIIASDIGRGEAGQAVVYSKSVSEADPVFSQAYRELLAKTVERGTTQDEIHGQRAAPLPTSEMEEPAAARPAPQGRINLNVPFAEKTEAKRLGAHWDKEKKTWYVPENLDRKPFEKWMEAPRELSGMDITKQFADALRDAGLVVDGEPVMDGKWQRTTVTTSKKTKALKGAYIANLDDEIPNGYIQNFDTGYSAPWSPEGLILTDEQRRQFEQQSAENRRIREAELAVEREEVALRCAKKWERMAEPESHPYLDRKQVGAFGVKIDGDRLVQPLRDVDGKIWSLQYIPADPGQLKLFEKGGQKTGNFHVLGDLDAGDVVLFGEGYATCASLHMATGHPVVEVFDSGNIEPVVAKLKGHLPGKTLLICGDDDVLTPERVLKTLNKIVTAEYTQKKLEVAEVRPEELVIDGQRRPLAGNPQCFMRLGYKTGPEGVQRVVGEFDNEATGQHVPILVNNVGREKALAAAAAHGAETVFPRFQTLEGGPSDFNDLHAREGDDAVLSQVAPAIARVREANGRPTIAAAEYAAMQGADRAFQEALVHVYGEARAGEMRYVTRHEDPGVSAAAAGFIEACDAWRTAVRAGAVSPEQVAKRALGEAAVVIPPKDSGRYVGPVLGNTDRHAVQDVGRQTAVAHELDKLDRHPVEGQRARIEYQAGRGSVQECPEPRRAHALQR